MRKSIFLIGVLLITFFSLPEASAAIRYQLSDRSKVYFGSPDRIQRPCTVEVQRIVEQFPSYKEALTQPEGSAKRIHGLKKACDEFKELLSRHCKEKKFELVAEKGSLSGICDQQNKAIEIPDITEELLKGLVR